MSTIVPADRRDDFVTGSFHQLLRTASPDTLHAIFAPATGRERLAAGKSARLLRAGDRVAVGDLLPERALRPGTATVDTVTLTARGNAAIDTVEFGLFTVPGSRLIVFLRES